MARGHEYQGGRFVGISKGGVEWVCYGDDLAYYEMCRLFDKTQR